MAEPTSPPALAGGIDCDLHAEVPGLQALLPYLPPFMVEQARNTVFRGPTIGPG